MYTFAGNIGIMLSTPRKCSPEEKGVYQINDQKPKELSCWLDANVVSTQLFINQGGKFDANLFEMHFTLRHILINTDTQYVNNHS